MKVALLGAGRVGRLHARLLSRTPGVDELVIFDPLPDRAAEAAAEADTLAGGEPAPSAGRAPTRG